MSYDNLTDPPVTLYQSYILDQRVPEHFQLDRAIRELGQSVVLYLIEHPGSWKITTEVTTDENEQHHYFTSDGKNHPYDRKTIRVQIDPPPAA